MSWFVRAETVGDGIQWLDKSADGSSNRRESDKWDWYFTFAAAFKTKSDAVKTITRLRITGKIYTKGMTITVVQSTLAENVQAAYLEESTE